MSGKMKKGDDVKKTATAILLGLLAALGGIPAGCGPADVEHPAAALNPVERKWECNLFVGRDSRGKQPAEAFGEGEKIYARAVFRDLTPGEHRASFLWYDPEGSVRERWKKTKRTGTNWNCWSWLRVRGGREGLGVLLPSSVSVTGEWKVVVSLDGIEAARKRFRIR